MIEEALWKVLGFFLAVILMFMAPLITLYDRQDDINYSLIYTELNQLADIVRDTGKLDERVYEDFLRRLSLTGSQYRITLEHLEKVYVPIYDASGVFQEDYQISYNGTYKEGIESMLQTHGTYEMAIGDLFFLTVENSSPTKSQIVRQIFYGLSSKYPSIYIRGGGMIRHDAY
jgi:hypothetical protein